MTNPAVPALFVGHGSPMNAIDRNRYTESWRSFGRSVRPVRAILVISAHWFINATALTAMARPRTIHDFYGFPPELYAVDYPAPGLPELASTIAEMVKPHWVGLDEDSWGIDHGAWSVLVHAFPDSDVPVLQLSINALKPFEYHVELGARLAPLRRQGVLIVASGNVVHNLRRLDREQPNSAFDWNRRFDNAVQSTMLSAPADIVRLAEHADYDLAVPTPEHFVPLLYLAGLASAEGRPAELLLEGYAMGSLSMTAYTLGGHSGLQAQMQNGAPPLGAVPGDQANI
jgi:4,5-DOPA dioxygenase extradiol